MRRQSNEKHNLFSNSLASAGRDFVWYYKVREMWGVFLFGGLQFLMWKIGPPKGNTCFRLEHPRFFSSAILFHDFPHFHLVEHPAALQGQDYTKTQNRTCLKELRHGWASTPTSNITSKENDSTCENVASIGWRKNCKQMRSILNVLFIDMQARTTSVIITDK